MKAHALKMLFASQIRGKCLITSLATLLLLALCGNIARANVITWTNVNSGEWSAATNWSPNLVPGPGDDVYITNSTVALDFNTSVASLTLTGGVLGGASSLAVNGPFTWGGGSIENTGGVTLNGASSLKSGAADGMAMSSGGLLINAGTVTWSGSGFNLSLAVGTTFTNLSSGTINIAADVSSQNGGTIGNAGLIAKTGGIGTTTFDTPFVNTGTVEVQSGTLDWASAVLAGGTFEVSANATLQLDGQTSVTSACSEGGAGMVLISAGTLNCAAGFTVNGPFTWSGGSIENTGGVTLNGTSSLNSLVADGMSMSSGGLLINAGTLTWSGSGPNLDLAVGTTFTNLSSGTIIIAADVSSQNGGTIGNAGLVTKTGTTGTTTLTTPFINTGTLNVQSGTISLNGGGTESSLVTNASGTSLFFGGGTHTVLAGFTATGPGSLGISGGTANFTSMAGSTVSNLVLSGGVLGGSALLAVDGTFTWSGGSIENTGGVTLNGTSSLNSVVADGMTMSSGGLLINAGTLTWSGSGPNLDLAVGTTLTNLSSGTIIITTNVSSQNGGTIGNAGLITKTGGTTTFDTPFVNTGTVEVQSGTLDWASAVLAGGTFEVSANATLQLDGQTSVTSACSEGGAGMVLMSAGTLSGASSFTVNGPFTWSGGSIENTGGVTLNGTSSLNSLVADGMSMSSGGLLINAGTLTWSGSGPNLDLAVGTTFTNLSSGTIIIAADVSSQNGGTIGNAGLVTKTGTTGTTTLTTPFINTGTLNAQSGTISLNGGYTSRNGALDFGISGATNYGTINLPGAVSFKGGLGVNLNRFYWPTVGSAFNLLTYTSETGVLFTNTSLPAFITWQTNYNPTQFTLSVVARQTNATPTNLTVSRAGNTNLNLAWPGDHTGWELEAQTNSLQSNNWVIVPGSGLTNEMTFPIGMANATVFFRLVYP